jgi:hypothetical protein
MDESQVEEIETSMQYIIESHPARATNVAEFEGAAEQVTDLDGVMDMEAGI